MRRARKNPVAVGLVVGLVVVVDFLVDEVDAEDVGATKVLGHASRYLRQSR